MTHSDERLHVVLHDDDELIAQGREIRHAAQLRQPIGSRDGGVRHRHASLFPQFIETIHQLQQGNEGR